MFSQEFREAYRTARIKHDDAHHSFPFDNCYMPECKAVWEKMNAPNKITDPKKQLEKLVSCQAAWENFLHTLTGLSVKVSLTAHSTSNAEADLLQLFEAGIAMPEFEQQSTSRKTWIAHTDLSKNICIFMPDRFNADEYPEPEDDEGYAQAIEIADAAKTEILNEEREDEIPV